MDYDINTVEIGLTLKYDYNSTILRSKKMGFSEIFKDKNEYNEKSIIGFMSFKVMTLTSIVDMITVLEVN